MGLLLCTSFVSRHYKEKIFDISLPNLVRAIVRSIASLRLLLVIIAI